MSEIAKQIKILRKYITEKRWARFQEVIQYRTEYITVVLEDIYQPHNASAVLRTCDIFGIQNVHIIENRNQYRINPDVAVGAYKWLNIKKYNAQAHNTLEAIKYLRGQGYRIVATTPHRNDTHLQDFDISKGKIALFFGTELEGLSDVMLNNADEYLKIEMFGFTESFNISVSAAIVLYHLINKLHKSNILWQLPPQKRDEILLHWLKKSVKNSEQILRNSDL